MLNKMHYDIPLDGLVAPEAAGTARNLVQAVFRQLTGILHLFQKLLCSIGRYLKAFFCKNRNNFFCTRCIADLLDEFGIRAQFLCAGSVSSAANKIRIKQCIWSLLVSAVIRKANRFVIADKRIQVFTFNEHIGHIIRRTGGKVCNI